MKNHLLPNCKCPNCDKLIDSATNMDGTDISPQEDDISICFYCGAVLRYDKDLAVEEVSTSFIDDLKLNDRENYDNLIDILIKIKSKR